MPHHQFPSDRGSLFVTYSVIFPEKLSDATKTRKKEREKGNNIHRNLTSILCSLCTCILPLHSMQSIHAVSCTSNMTLVFSLFPGRAQGIADIGGLLRRWND